MPDARGFAPGMGVAVVDKKHRTAWYPSVRTIVRMEGQTLFFDRYLHLDYQVEDAGEVFNAFPLIAGYEVEDVVVSDLTADGNRSHDNGQVGIFLCWRVQHGTFERNQCWANGEYGISIGHKDTDNVFVRNLVSGNAKAGIYFRDEAEINAGHRNTFRENTIEDNGRPDTPA